MTPRQMAMLDACDRYVTGLAAAYDRSRDSDSDARYRHDVEALGLILGRDVRMADRENPTDAA